MVLYIGIYIESDWLYHAEWVALSNGQSGSELAEYSTGIHIREKRIAKEVSDCEIKCYTVKHRALYVPFWFL